MFSDRIERAHAERLQQAAANPEAASGELTAPAAGRLPRVLAGAGMLARHGLVMQALGTNAWELRRLLDSVWSAIRSDLTGLAPLSARDGTGGP